MVDTSTALQHPTHMLLFSRRLAVLLLTLALSGSNVALCAGWKPTSEARMACCSEGAACPMHRSDSHDPSARNAVTQAEADNCCAAAEQEGSAPSASAFVFSVALALVPSPVPLDLPGASLRPDIWRTLIPVPGTPVPKHLLLSVQLV